MHLCLNANVGACLVYDLSSHLSVPFASLYSRFCHFLDSSSFAEFFTSIHMKNSSSHLNMHFAFCEQNFDSIVSNIICMHIWWHINISCCCKNKQATAAAAAAAAVFKKSNLKDWEWQTLESNMNLKIHSDDLKHFAYLSTSD